MIDKKLRLIALLEEGPCSTSYQLVLNMLPEWGRRTNNPMLFMMMIPMKGNKWIGLWSSNLFNMVEVYKNFNS